MLQKRNLHCSTYNLSCTYSNVNCHRFRSKLPLTKPSIKIKRNRLISNLKSNSKILKEQKERYRNTYSARNGEVWKETSPARSAPPTYRRLILEATQPPPALPIKPQIHINPTNHNSRIKEKPK